MASMTDDDKQLPVVWREPEPASLLERAAQVLSVPLAAIPMAGGPISAALAAFAGQKTEQRLTRMIVLVEQRLVEMGKTVDDIERAEEGIKDEVIRLIVEARFVSDENKFSALKNAAVNCVISDQHLLMKRRLGRIAIELDPEHVTVLKAFRNHRFPFDAASPGERATSIDAVSATVSAALGSDAVAVLVVDLVSFGLIVDDSAGRLDSPRFSVMGITKFGLEFIDWISPMISHDVVV